MSRLLMSLALVLMAASPAAGSAERRTDPTLVGFADAFDRAQIRKDAAALERMVADDLIFIDGSGARLGKRDFVAGWTAPGDRYDPVLLEDRTFTWLGPNAAIVGATATLTGTSEGKNFSSRIRFADTFRRIKGRWRAVHIQVTRIR